MFFHQPHLYCVTTLPSKTNTTANISVKCLHFSRNVIVSVGGKTGVVFIDPGAKVNSSYYCNVVLEEGLLPEIRAICHHYRWTPHQDGAPAHTARTTMDYLQKRPHQLHWTKHVASKQPDINPVDYAIWAALQQRVYHHHQFKAVEASDVTEWQKLSQRFIDNSINEWRRNV